MNERAGKQTTAGAPGPASIRRMCELIVIVTGRSRRAASAISRQDTGGTHVVDVRALDGRARRGSSAGRGRGAAARPPAGEYHRRTRMWPLRAAGSRAADAADVDPSLSARTRPHSRIYKRNSTRTRASRGRIQLFTRLSALTSSGALRRRARRLVCPAR